MEQTAEDLEQEHKLELEIQPADDTPQIRLITIRGDVDMSNTARLAHALTTVIEDGACDVLLDFHEVGYMDSSGFGTLFSALKHLRPMGGSIHLIHCNPVILRMLEITRLNTVLGMHDTEADARAVLQKLYAAR